MKRALFVALVLATPLVSVQGASLQETGLDVRAWYGAVGGAKPDLTASGVVIEIVNLDSGVAFATDDPATAAFVCRSGDPTDVCTPPGGDVFNPAEQNRAFATFQPGEWTDGDQVAVTIRIVGNATTGVGSVVLREGGVSVDVILVRPPDSIQLVAFPSTRAIVPGDAALFTVKVLSLRPVSDVIDLTLSPLPVGWTGAFDASAAALAPGESFTTILRVQSPPVTQDPYGPGSDPVVVTFRVFATPRNATEIAKNAPLQILVPMIVKIEAFEPRRALLVLAECQAIVGNGTPCYPDLTQQVSFDVNASWVDGSPVAGALARVAISHKLPGGGVPIATITVANVTNASGMARIVMPFNDPWFLNSLGVAQLNLPGAYGVVARVQDYGIRGLNSTTFFVGPVT